MLKLPLIIPLIPRICFLMIKHGRPLSIFPHTYLCLGFSLNLQPRLSKRKGVIATLGVLSNVYYHLHPLTVIGHDTEDRKERKKITGLWGTHWIPMEANTDNLIWNETWLKYWWECGELQCSLVPRLRTPKIRPNLSGLKQDQDNS